MEVRVEGNTSKPLLALVASADGSFSSWTSEVGDVLAHCVCNSRFFICTVSNVRVCLSCSHVYIVLCAMD